MRVTLGEVFDVAVDLRRSSPTFGRAVGIALSAANKRMLWIPPGFAHGFVVVSDVAEFLYKTTDFWYPEHERTLLWNDPALGIDWPLDGEPILAAKDAAGTPLASAETYAVTSRMRILLTGHERTGRLRARAAAARSGDVIATDRAALDLAQPDAIVKAMRDAKPDLVVNAGAYTAVDLAERERDVAFAVNATRAADPRGGSEAQRRAAGPLLDRLRVRRRGDDALRRGCADRRRSTSTARASSQASRRSPRPARARWFCARAGCTARGQELPADDPAARARARRAAHRRGPDGHAQLVAHARGGDGARWSARGLPALAERAGLYHLSSAGVTTWHGFARAIVGDAARARASRRSRPANTRRRRGGRPTACWPRRSSSATFGFALPAWQDALAACLREERAGTSRLNLARAPLQPPTSSAGSSRETSDPAARGRLHVRPCERRGVGRHRSPAVDRQWPGLRSSRRCPARGAGEARRPGRSAARRRAGSTLARPARAEVESLAAPKSGRLEIGFGARSLQASRDIVLRDLSWTTTASGAARRARRDRIAGCRGARGRACARPPIAGLAVRVRGFRGERSATSTAGDIAAASARFGQFWTPVLAGEVATSSIEVAGVPASTA